jgi:hypothetical protein
MTRLRRILAIAAVLSAAGLGAAVQEPPRGPFEVRHIIAHGRRADTQFYDFTGDGVLDAFVSSIDGDVDPPVRWLALHIGTKAGGIPEKPDQIWPVADSTCAIALGNLVPEGGVDILEIAPDGVYYHAFEKGAMTEEPRKLLHTRTFFTTPSPRALPTWSYPQDLSNDGRDDLVLPVPDGYKVYFQTEPGRFARVARIEADLAPGKARTLSPLRFAVDWDRSVARGLPPTSALFNLHDELPRLTPVDLNGDKLLDLVSIRGSQMTVFFQRAPMSFPAAARVQNQIEALREERKKDTVNVSDVQFCDINADDRMDLIVTKIEGELGLLDSIKTRIYPHLGTGRANFQADSLIFIDGISLNPSFLDMNGDGKLDVLTSRLRTDLIRQAISTGIFGDITVTYEVFQFDGARNTYSTSAVYGRDILIPTDDIRKPGAATRPFFYVAGDLSGDGRPDAVTYDPKRRRVEVHRGRSIWEAGGGRQIIDFEKNVAASHPIEGDHDPKWLGFFDLDGDKRTDIVLNYGSMVVILLSRF